MLGRIDDVINVSGHRLGTKEIESACLAVAEVSEAAVVAVHDDLKGTVPELYVSVGANVTDRDAVAKKVIAAVEDIIGKIARPERVYVVPDMPKTRSGKIMRRVLGALSNKKDTGDVSTLANPEIVEEIRKLVQGQGK